MFTSEVKHENDEQLDNCPEKRENVDHKEKSIFMAGNGALVARSVPISSLGESLDRQAPGVLMQVRLPH